MTPIAASLPSGSMSTPVPARLSERLRKHVACESRTPNRSGARLTELAARSNMTLPAMAELVDELEQAGYVARRPDPSDGRAKLIRPTHEGRRALARALRAVREIEDQYAEGSVRSVSMRSSRASRRCWTSNRVATSNDAVSVQTDHASRRLAPAGRRSRGPTSRQAQRPARALGPVAPRRDRTPPVVHVAELQPQRPAAS